MKHFVKGLAALFCCLPLASFGAATDIGFSPWTKNVKWYRAAAQSDLSSLTPSADAGTIACAWAVSENTIHTYNGTSWTTGGPCSTGSTAGGGTYIADDGDFTAGTTSMTPVGGFYQSSPTACTDGDTCAIGITSSREVKVDLSATVETYFSDTATAVVEVAGATYADDDDFTDGTSKSNLAGGVAETTNTPSTVTDGDIGAFGMTLNRAIKNYAIADENQLGPVTCVVGGTSTDNTALTTTIATEKQVVTYYSFQGEGAVEVWLEDDDATEITPHCVVAASGDGCVFNPNHPGTLQTNADGDTITLQLSAAVVVNYTMCWTSID